MSLNTGELAIRGPLYTLNSTSLAMRVRFPSSNQNSSSGSGDVGPVSLGVSGSSSSTAVGSREVVSVGVEDPLCASLASGGVVDILVASTRK